MKAQDSCGLLISIKPSHTCKSNFVILQAIFHFLCFMDIRKTHYLAKKFSCPAWSVFFINPDFISDGNLSAGENGVILRTEQPSSIKRAKNSEIIKNFQLSQNYLKPFNPVTSIKYQVARQSHVELSIYNIVGQ